MIWTIFGYLATWMAGGMVLLFTIGFLLEKNSTRLNKLKQFWRAIIILICGPLAILGLMWGCYETEGSVMPFVRFFLKSLLSPLAFIFLVQKETEPEDDTIRYDHVGERNTAQTRSDLLDPLASISTAPVPRARNIKVDIVSTNRKSWFNFKK